MKTQTVRSKLPKSVKRITILKSDTAAADAGGSDRVVVKRKRKRKKQSKGFVKIWERATRSATEANKRMGDEYLSRHKRSNRKRRDGWLRDYSYNWMKARRKGGKKFKLSKILGF